MFRSPLQPTWDLTLFFSFVLIFIFLKQRNSRSTHDYASKQQLVKKVAAYFIKISCRRKYHTTSSHDRFSNEGSNLKEPKVRNTKDYQQTSNIRTLVNFGEITVSGPSVRIRLSKFLANLDENSSSVSPVTSLSYLAL